MQFRMMDEVSDLGERGVLLICCEAPDGEPTEGMQLKDAKGNIHTIDKVSLQYGMYFLHIRSGKADYFERMFRDVRIDALRFEEVPPCQ